MTGDSRQLQRYLRRLSVSGPWMISPPQQRSYQACIVIPSMAESKSLPKTLNSLSTNNQDDLERTLVLVVINNRSNSDSRLQQDNAKTLRQLRNQAGNLNLTWVDAFSPGHALPLDQGVGLARKIGFDLALSQLDWSAAPFLISLDADTLVSTDYLSSLFAHFSSKPSGGAVIPFRHQAGETDDQEQAIRRYELYLRSYSYGLQQACSPYAYNSVGSAMACSAAAYLQCGGMNRRTAGEDFYFLQQLAKTSGIDLVQGALVSPSPRESFRVPFGTGRTMTAHLQGSETSYTFSPQPAFQVLKDFLTLVSNHWHCSASQLLREASLIDGRLLTFLEIINFNRTWPRLQATHTLQKQFIRAFHGWFDGLRTRQLLSSLTSSEDSDPMVLVNNLLLWGGYDPQPDIPAQLMLLEQLQGVPTQ